MFTLSRWQSQSPQNPHNSPNARPSSQLPNHLSRPGRRRLEFPSDSSSDEGANDGGRLLSLPFHLEFESSQHDSQSNSLSSTTGSYATAPTSLNPQESIASSKARSGADGPQARPDPPSSPCHLSQLLQEPSDSSLIPRISTRLLGSSKSVRTRCRALDEEDEALEADGDHEGRDKSGVRRSIHQVPESTSDTHAPIKKPRVMKTSQHRSKQSKLPFAQTAARPSKSTKPPPPPSDLLSSVGVLTSAHGPSHSRWSRSSHLAPGPPQPTPQNHDYLDSPAISPTHVTSDNPQFSTRILGSALSLLNIDAHAPDDSHILLSEDEVDFSDMSAPAPVLPPPITCDLSLNEGPGRRYGEKATPNIRDEGEFDDAALLARLMQQAEGMREGQEERPVTTPASEQSKRVGIMANNEGSVDDAGMQEDVPAANPNAHVIRMGNVAVLEDRASRRERALSYLESLPLNLISQVYASLVQVNSFQTLKTSRTGPTSGPGSKKGKDREQVQVTDGMDILQSEEEEEDADAAGGIPSVKLELKNRKTGGMQMVVFPDEPQVGRSRSQYRLACILRVAELLYAAVLTGVVITKRDIFYKDVALFRDQRVVDAIVDDIVASAGMRRQDLFVCATSKGLIASDCINLTLRSGKQISLSAINATLIPPIERIADLNGVDSSPDRVDWVLVVEKDAVFQTLCGAGLLLRQDLGAGVMITGKGYPDLATLQLLRRIADTWPMAKIHVLVDADPHGIDILSVYTYGSASSRFSVDHAGLALGDRVEWMGVKATEWTGLGVRYEDLLPLTDRDVEKAHAMLRNGRNLPPAWRREIVQMLHLNKKAEIQIAGSALPGMMEGTLGGNNGGMQVDEYGHAHEGGLAGYVVRKLREDYR